MIGGLPEALETLLTGSLPTLFGDGNGDTVGLSVSGGLLEMDERQDADAAASEPRPEDRVDDLAFDPDDPAGPYALSQPPYPGPRRVWLTTQTGGRTSLRPEEVVWDRADARRFSLALMPQRDASAFVGVRVLYGVTAVYTKVNAIQTIEVGLGSSDEDLLERAEALVVAVIQLNRKRLVEEARSLYEDGDYAAVVELKNLKNLAVARGSRADKARLLTLRAELELKASRALGEDEGVPIEHILTPGRPPDPDRPVDVHPDVEA